MFDIKPLPSDLVQRYQEWRSGAAAQRAWYARLAQGQQPRALVISCCDSRVLASAIFGAQQGEFFIHRNIANLVPPYAPDGEHHGTSAAIEYAVVALGVPHAMVIGHSHCGGVQGCISLCKGEAPELERGTSFIGPWLDILRPHYHKVADIADAQAQARAFEKQGVLASLENLMTFPFVKARVDAGELALHGLWKDIGEAQVEYYDAPSQRFRPL